MQIVLDRPDLIAIDKPAGTPTIPDRFGSDSVHDQLERKLGQQLWIVHRLDREVTGILVFARTAAAHRLLSSAFEQRRAHKTYEAWTSGPVPGPQEVEFLWQDKLLRGKKRSYPHVAGKEAITAARYLGPAPQVGLHRWLLEPRTGRNHQLRVHLSGRGWPIAGDQLYGSDVAWRESEIALRAVALAFDREVLGSALEIRVDGLREFSLTAT